MATQAEMIQKIVDIPLDPTTAVLGEVKQNDTEYWTLAGNIKLASQDGSPAIYIPVSFQEPKT